MHRLPQCHLGNPRVECQNVYQVNQYDNPLSPRVFICKTNIKCSQIHKSIQSNKMKSQREKSIHHNKIEREKHHIIQLYYQSPRYIKIVPHQEHERERERDQTHRYWYIPSASRVNYSLLVMESAGMMKMAIGDGFPLRQGAGTGSREVFWWLRRLAAAELPIYLRYRCF